jgi:Tfp pilus assembly protein FimT
MSKQVIDFQTNRTKLSNSAGVSAVELLIVGALVSLVSTMALVNFQQSSRSFTVAGATRTLSSYLEKARVDSVRRHGGASININSASSYTVNIDFEGDGLATNRTINLPAGTTLAYRLPPATATINPTDTPVLITYDWRGRTGSTVALTVTSSTTGVTPSTMVVGPAGDISSDSTVTGPVTTPTPQNTTVSTTSGIKTMR